MPSPPGVDHVVRELAAIVPTKTLASSIIKAQNWGMATLLMKMPLEKDGRKNQTIN
jgi:hypothetical protein